MNSSRFCANEATEDNKSLLQPHKGELGKGRLVGRRSAEIRFIRTCGRFREMPGEQP